MDTRTTPRYLLVLLRHFATSTGFFQLADELDPEFYTFLPVDFHTSVRQHADEATIETYASEVVALLDDNPQTHDHRVILIAHGIDVDLAKQILAQAPTRIAGLFLIGLAPCRKSESHPTPTMIVAASQTFAITTRLFETELQNTLPNSECVPFDDDSLLDLDQGCAPLAEVLHAFCLLRIEPLSKQQGRVTA